ncbi:MAG: AAA family ATPase, partial [Rhodospirillaceae bacterium]
MLRSLITEGIGPAARFEMEFGSRLNLITGDNGLGKSFLLDIAWWVCARDWPDQPALPTLQAGRGRRITPNLTAALDGLTRNNVTTNYTFAPER